MRDEDHHVDVLLSVTQYDDVFKLRGLCESHGVLLNPHIFV